MASKIITIGDLEFKFHWLVAACIVITISGLVRLGLWQLDRTQEKFELQSNFQNMQELDATTMEYVPVSTLEFDSLQLQNRQVLLEGNYLNEQTIYQIYQPYQDQIGYEIVSPFKLASMDMVVMVSRGWSGASNDKELSERIPLIEGQINLLGQIFVPTEAMNSKTNNLSEIKWPLTIRFLNFEELGPQFSSPLFPYVIRLNEDQAGVLIRHWPEALVDVGRNFNYALQWFAMAIAVVIISLILSSNILKLIEKKLKPL